MMSFEWLLLIFTGILLLVFVIVIRWEGARVHKRHETQEYIFNTIAAHRRLIQQHVEQLAVQRRQLLLERDTSAQ